MAQRKTPDDQLHPSYALAQIPDWAAVRQCLEVKPRLPALPLWLQRLGRACRATGKPEQHLNFVEPLKRAETRLMLQLIDARRIGKDEIALRKALGEVDFGIAGPRYLSVVVR